MSNTISITRNDITSTPADFDKAIKSIDRLSRVVLKSPLKGYRADVCKVPVERLDCSFGIVRTEGKHMPLEKVLLNERRRENAKITIVFAIRRPGKFFRKCHVFLRSISALTINRRYGLQ